MTLDVLASFLLWCFLINAALLVWYFVMFRLAHDWIYRFHGKWFKMSVETFDGIHYGLMAVYKTAIIFFNLVPYLATLIVK